MVTEKYDRFHTMFCYSAGALEQNEIKHATKLQKVDFFSEMIEEYYVTD